MNALKKISIIAGLTGLVSCKSIEIVHVSLECVDKPAVKLSERLTVQELTRIESNTFDKLEKHIINYQERLKSECELIKRHNQAHKS